MKKSTENGGSDLCFRAPRSEDGPAISSLIAACPPLDTNSAYCNLLQSSHFADTCVVVEQDGEIVGWISGYRLPAEPDVFFVWQVAVGEKARGLGLGRRMIEHLLARPSARGVKTLHTTITDDNAASWGLFGSFARRRGAELKKTPFFTRDTHFAGAHDTEFLAEIGPLDASSEQSNQADTADKIRNAQLEATQ